MSHLVITDDNPRDRSYLADVLSDFSLTITTNVQEAITACDEQTDPFLVTDIQMPDGNGIELARMLWNKQPSARILFWSQHNDELYVRELVKLVPAETVYGYVLKNNTSETILRAAHAVFDECQCWIDPSVRQVQARSQHTSDMLTDAQYDVLIDIALGLTDNTIAERRYLSRRGVQNRLQSLYSKLGANLEQNDVSTDTELLNVRTRAISIALQRGLINAFELSKEEELLSSWLKDNKI